METNQRNKRDILKEKDRIRKQRQRSLYNDEKKEEMKVKQREYTRKKRLLQSDEEKELKREQARVATQLRRMKQGEEEKELNREQVRVATQIRRMKQGEEEKELEREKNRVNIQIWRNELSEEMKEQTKKRKKEYQSQKRSALSEEEKQQERNRNSSSKQQKRLAQNVCTSKSHNFHIERNCFAQESNSMESYDLAKDVMCTDGLLEYQAIINRTLLTCEEEGYIEGKSIHRALVCVVCDRCIIGTDSYHWISSKTLKYHEKILSASYHYSNGINAYLKLQYAVADDDIFHLLLSPRARKRVSDNSYMCCSECYKVLSELQVRKKPPKYAISNGFAIGNLPSNISRDITPLVNNLVAPIRAFNYFVSFNGGREQKITGNFTFFAQDVSQNMGTLQHVTSTGNNPSVYIVLLGSFTTAQIEKIKRHGSYNVETFKNVYKFLHDNNDYYSTLPSINDVPLPCIEQIHLNDGRDLVEEGTNSNTEQELCWKYWFPSVQDPNSISGSYQNCSEFAKALFIGEAPTLLYHPTKIITHAKLSQLCPLAFPFGTGDVNIKRSPAVNEIECLQHYLKLSLPQFLEGQTILIIHHMYQRRKSFLSGIAKCNVSHSGCTIADQLAAMTVQQVDDAITEMKKKARKGRESKSANTNDSMEGDGVSQNVTELLKCIKTSCVPIGYTNEAAAEARNKMFALWMTFGPPALLFTFSPCDECSFKMQLFATMESTELSSLHKPVEVLTRELGIRKSLRVKYPGSCAREFDSLLQIVVKHLLGWDNNNDSHCGIFGKINALATGVEEQGRTTLHGHIVAWVQNYHNLQQQLFSNNKEVREKAMENMKNFLDKVLCSSFNISEDEVMSSLHEKCKCSSNVDQLAGVSFQQLRDMRHIELRKKYEGKILSCNICSKHWDTNEIVNSVAEKLFHWSKQEHPMFWPEGITFPLQHEQLELLALRTQYDMVNLNQAGKKFTCRLLQLIVALFFNTHDWRHRKACFKKSNECRFHIPHKPCQELTLSFHDENYFDNLSDDIHHEDCNFDNGTSNVMSNWYHYDGTRHKVCSYEVEPKRDEWDVFVNTNNSTVTRMFGYNNNITIGSISLLYYCTLYTSKSNQEDETYPYVKALEAVASRLKRVQENDSEGGISQRQVGLRNLLCGINSHISSCVVSATMAWYLVTHGSRFHFTHDFKPLLLSQFEAWFHGKSFTRRIRYKKVRKRRSNDDPTTVPQQCPGTPTLHEEDADVWLDSSINDYLYRPSEVDINFDNMCVWEYVSKFDLMSQRPKNFMDNSDTHDIDQTKFCFQRHHPGYEFSCLSKRDHECIPKLYYSNKFPDIAHLDMEKGNDVDDGVKELREVYAIKAMLMFYPFREKPDLLNGMESMWDSFMEQKTKLLNNSGQNEEILGPTLYKHSLQILQNIQDLLNIKKVRNGEETLQACTSLSEMEKIKDHSVNCKDDNIDVQEENTENFESQIEQLSHYINILSEENSVFNNSLTHTKSSNQVASNPSILSIKSSTYTDVLPSPQLELIVNNGTEMECFDSHNLPQPNIPIRSIVTILTKALDSDGVNLVLNHPLQDNQTNFSNETIQYIDGAICSMNQFALQNNLDRKQTVAFKTICSSFMMSFLLDTSMDISQSERNYYMQLLQKMGASQQLLMCVTGPGGSGKSHIIKCCRLYCKLFCDALGKAFNFSVFPVTATSNAAASLLQGFTIHSAALLNSNYVQMELSSDVNWTLTKVLIIDEISMADKNMFRTLDKNLRILTGNRHLLYGGIHIVFTGDFMQLPPVRGTPIFNEFDDLLWHQSINAAVFLDERNHRFLNDPEWGKILDRVQLGIPTDDDIVKMNSRLISLCEPPNNVDCKETRIAYGCYSNKRRNELSDAVFLKYVMSNAPLFNDARYPPEEILLLKCIATKQRKDVGEEFHKLLWALCGDDNLSVGTQAKVDPCLKLITGSPIMVNKTIDRKSHIVKGVSGNFIGVRYKFGKKPHIEDYYGYKVHAAYISDIECVIVNLSSVGNKIVEIHPELFSPTIRFPLCTTKNVLKGYQILQAPINLSLAITGHKLQGMTLDVLVLSEINLKANWLYVLLSRVTTLKGLYLMKPLRKEMFKAPCKNLRRELEWLRGLETQLLDKLKESMNM